MLRQMTKLAIQIGFAALAAIATPAAAAGVMQGVSIVGGAEVSVAINDTVPMAAPAPPAMLHGTLVEDDHTATAAPRRLNLMAGNDEIAWSNVGKKVHVAAKKK